MTLSQGGLRCRSARSARGLHLLLSLAAVLSASPAVAVVDPFYTTRLHEGIAAFERGAHADAAISLRIACFGMLDDAPQLANCLVRLALAQGAGGDREGFAATARRLIEGDELVGLYRQAALPAELAGPFEARLVEWVPRDTLEASTAFRRLVASKQEVELAALAPRARRQRLEALAKEQPREARWPLLLARLARDQGEPQAVLAATETALGLQPGLGEARCLRGWAAGELERFAAAAEDLAGCGLGDPTYLVAELAAQVALERWNAAEALAARLSAEQRRDGEVVALLRKVEKGLATAAPPPAPPPAEAAPPRPPEGQPTPVLASDDEARLSEARARLARARDNEEVLAAYVIVAELASRYPGERRVQYLAAEIAYRASRWSEAVRHFRQGGDPGEEQPLLLFYLAVALWETGQRREAAEAMRRCDGKLRSTPFVESYRQKILGGERTPG